MYCFSCTINVFFLSPEENSDVHTWWEYAVFLCHHRFLFVFHFPAWLLTFWIHKAFLIKQSALGLVWLNLLAAQRFFSQPYLKSKGMFVLLGLSGKWRLRLYGPFLKSPFSWNFTSLLVFQLSVFLAALTQCLCHLSRGQLIVKASCATINPLPWPLYFICLALPMIWQHYHPLHVTSDIIAIMRIPSSTTGSKPICVLAPTLDKTNSKFIQHASAI